MLSSSCESEDFGQTHQYAYLETRVSSTDRRPLTRLERTPFHTVGPLDSIMTASLCEFVRQTPAANFNPHEIIILRVRQTHRHANNISVWRAKSRTFSPRSKWIKNVDKNIDKRNKQ